MLFISAIVTLFACISPLFVYATSTREFIGSQQLKQIVTSNGIARYQLSESSKNSSPLRPRTVITSSDGRYAYIEYAPHYSFDAPVSGIFDMTTGQPLRTFEYIGRVTTTVGFYSFIPGTYEALIVGNEPGVVARYDVVSGELKPGFKIYSSDGQPLSNVTGAKFLPDRKSFYAFGFKTHKRDEDEQFLVCNTDGLNFQPSKTCSLQCQNKELPNFFHLLANGSIFSVSLPTEKGFSFLVEKNGQQQKYFMEGSNVGKKYIDFTVSENGKVVAASVEEHVGKTLDDLKLFDIVYIHSIDGKLLNTIRPYKIPQVTKVIDAADEDHKSKDMIKINKMLLSQDGQTLWLDLSGANEYISVEHAPSIRVELNTLTSEVKSIYQFDPQIDFIRLAHPTYPSLHTAQLTSGWTCAQLLEGPFGK